MGLTEARERFRELLPDELKGAHVAPLEDDERSRLLAIREGVLTAFEEAAPKPAPAVRIQTVDEYVGPGEYRRTFEVVDTRRAGKARIIAAVQTREEAESRRERAYLIPVGGKRVRPVGGAAYTYAAVDADEYWHDTDVETIASVHTYGVISGCTVTADASNLTVDLAAGTILHSASSVTVAVATDAYTLVADGSNERWAALTVGSAGTAVLVSGDPAASASSEPAKPEIGDRVIVAFAKIQAGQTIAANVEYLLDKRVITHAEANPFDGIRTQFRANRRLVAEYSATPATGATAVPIATGFVVDGVDASDEITAISGEPVQKFSVATAGLALVTSGARAGGTSPLAVLSPNHSPRMLLRVQFPAASANVTRFLAGFFATDSLTANGAYLRIATTGNVFFVTRQATETVTDLGVLSRTAVLGFEIETADAGVTWVCRDQAGTVLASHTATVPTVGTALMYGVIATTATAAVEWAVGYVRIEGTFA